MAWTETASEHLVARHEDVDRREVDELLEQLETTYHRLAGSFPAVPDELAVVIHGSEAALIAAMPIVGVVRALTAPAARRYVAGWPTASAIHVLAPRLLTARASNVPGSKELALLTPDALLAQAVVGHNTDRLPPPFKLRTLRRFTTWAWLFYGAGSYFGGQTDHARGPIGRRLKEGGEPSFPPGLRDAPLLGGTVIDLLAREEGEQAAIRFACDQLDDRPLPALERAFHGRSTLHTAGTWRAHLSRLAGAATDPTDAERAARRRPR